MGQSEVGGFLERHAESLASPGRMDRAPPLAAHELTPKHRAEATRKLRRTGLIARFFEHLRAPAGSASHLPGKFQ